MDKIYFLIDTNIFIQLEDNQIVKKSFAKFHSLCNKNSAVICIHKLSKKEIEKDDDQIRKNEALSKIKKYELLEKPPLEKKTKLEKLFGKINKNNDEIDCQLLFALYKNSVSFLVTEDTGIHKRAKKEDLKTRVLTISQANNMLDRLFPKEITISLPKIENPHLYDIDFNDEIFDSLKDEYKGFEDWFKKSSQEQIKAWVIKNLENKNKLESICIYKEAKGEDYLSYNLPKKSLKLATFKVDESYRGKKLGELMLKQAFLYAVENSYKSCWMTVFPKHEVLIDFIKDFGFMKIGETNQRDNKTGEPELIFRKDFIKPENYPLRGLDFHIKYSPFYDDRKDIEKHIIPIQEKYYYILFPEQKLQISFPIAENETPGNTIKKVYLCHAATKQLKCNDLVFFYVSSPVQAITSIGIIESVFRSDELLKVVSHIGKRSVYSFSEIEKMTKQKVLVIEFRFIKHLKKEINLNQLKKENIIQGPPQSIQNLKNYEKFKQIFLQIS